MAANGTLQLFRGNTTQNNGFTGAVAELTYDTGEKRIRIHDGSTVGGIKLARLDDIPASPDLSPYARKDQATTFTSTVTATSMYVHDYIYHQGDANSYLGFGARDSFTIVAGGRELVRLDEGSDPDTAQFMSSQFQMTSAGNFTAAGNITSNSDLRLKENIQKIDNALDKVQQLNGVLFTRKDTGERLTGLIAQDVQKVLPEAVNGDDILSVAYGNIVGLLVEAIKELREIVEPVVADASLET